MKHNDPIKNIMTAEVKTVHTQQAVSDVRKIMTENHIHHVPVLNGKELIGMISMTDIMKLSFTAYGTDERSVDAILDKEFTIEKVMQKELRCLSDKDTVRKAAEMLSEGVYHSLPVVGEDNELCGIVTSTDLIKYLLDQY